MTKFSNKLKKPCFWSILGPFSQFLVKKKIFPENLAPSRTTSYAFLAPCQISEKTNDTIPRKRLDRRTDGRTDRPFQLLPGVQKFYRNSILKTSFWHFLCLQRIKHNHYWKKTFEATRLYQISNSRTVKICQNHNAYLLRFLFTEDSLKNKKGLRTSFQATFSHNFLITIFLL